MFAGRSTVLFASVHFQGECWHLGPHAGRLNTTLVLSTYTTPAIHLFRVPSALSCLPEVEQDTHKYIVYEPDSACILKI